tara:strand:- start:776 stop:1474 length:699 start_codon:yes stop_codon:yes gene_type:complete
MRLLFVLLLIISCEEPLELCNVMDGNSSCYQEPNTILVNYYDFEDIIYNTDIVLHVTGNNTSAGFAYNLDNNYWIDTTSIEGIINLDKLSEGIHNINIRSYYPDGEIDPSPLSLDFIIDAINVNFSYESCANNSTNFNILKYQFISDSYINSMKTNLVSNDITYTWIFETENDTSSYIANYFQSNCYEFNKSSDSTYYDVTLLINTGYSLDTLTKEKILVIPSLSNAGPGGF